MVGQLEPGGASCRLWVPTAPISFLRPSPGPGSRHPRWALPYTPSGSLFLLSQPNSRVEKAKLGWPGEVPSAAWAQTLAWPPKGGYRFSAMAEGSGQSWRWWQARVEAARSPRRTSRASRPDIQPGRGPGPAGGASEPPHGPQGALRVRVRGSKAPAAPAVRGADAGGVLPRKPGDRAPFCPFLEPSGPGPPGEKRPPPAPTRLRAAAPRLLRVEVFSGSTPHGGLRSPLAGPGREGWWGARAARSGGGVAGACRAVGEARGRARREGGGRAYKGGLREEGAAEPRPAVLGFREPPRAVRCAPPRGRADTGASAGPSRRHRRGAVGPGPRRRTRRARRRSCRHRPAGVLAAARGTCSDPPCAPCAGRGSPAPPFSAAAAERPRAGSAGPSGMEPHVLGAVLYWLLLPFVLLAGELGSALRALVWDGVCVPAPGFRPDQPARLAGRGPCAGGRARRFPGTRAALGAGIPEA